MREVCSLFCHDKVDAFSFLLKFCYDIYSVLRSVLSKSSSSSIWRVTTYAVIHAGLYYKILSRLIKITTRVYKSVPLLRSDVTGFEPTTGLLIGRTC